MWNILEGPEHNFIDGRTHVHHVHLFNRVTGGEHEVQLLLHTPTCRECNRPFEQSDLSMLDPHAETEKVLKILHQNHGAIMDYVGQHGIPIRLGPKANLVLAGHKTVIRGNTTLLHVPRKP